MRVNSQSDYRRLLGRCVLASYFPGLFWVFTIPAAGGHGLSFMLSPVALPMVLIDDSYGLGYAMACPFSFILCIVLLAYFFQRTRSAAFVLPMFFFFICLVQGVICAHLLAGLDSIGKS